MKAKTPSFRLRRGHRDEGLRLLACPCFLVVVSLALPPPAAASFINPGQGVSFSQVSFTYSGASQPFSQYGQAFVDYQDLVSTNPTFSSGFVNVVTGAGWAVQNLPISFASGYPGLSTMFDLGASGPQGMINAYADFSPVPLLSAPAGMLQPFGLSQISTNAQGDTTPRPAPPGPPPPNGGVTFANQSFSSIFQPNHPASVEQDVNQCGPAAVSNSLQYLQNRYGVQFPDQNIPGIAGSPPNSRVGQLDNTFGRAAGHTVNNYQFLNGKLQYLSNVGVTGLVLEHQGGDRVSPPAGGIGNGNFTTGSLTSSDNGATVTSDFILDELAKGEDVEMNIRWLGGGGHWVTLIGGGTAGGNPWVAYNNDYTQGANGGTGLLDGGYGFSYLTTATDGTLRFRNFVDGEEARVNFVVAQSIPEPSSIFLATIGLGLVMAARQWTRLRPAA